MRQDVPGEQGERRQDCSLLGQAGKRKPERRLPSPALHVGAQAPEGKSGGGQVEVGERALGKEYGIDRRQDRGRDRDLEVGHRLRQAKQAEQSKRSRQKHGRSSHDRGEPHQLSTTAPGKPSPAAGEHWRWWSAESGCRSTTGPAPQGCNSRLRPRNRAGAARAHAAPAAPQRSERIRALDGGGAKADRWVSKVIQACNKAGHPVRLDGRDARPPLSAPGREPSCAGPV